MHKNTDWGSFLPDFQPKSKVLSGYFPNLSSKVVAGIDEAGRGCFAGPVVAAAVILPEDYQLQGLGDSKVLSESRRNGLSAQIGVQAIAWGIGLSWQREIDSINILQASLKAMSRALAALKIKPEAILIDGPHSIPPHFLNAYQINPQLRQQAVIDGDALVPIISAASILAKTFRDNLMERLDVRYPGYGFAEHKGYGTKNHREALSNLGPCRLHRLSYKGVGKTEEVQTQGLLC